MNQRIRKLLSSFLLLTMLCASQQVLGVRANPNPVQVLQPDGSKLWIRIHGDENHHFITTTDGYKIRKDHDGYYRYITGQDTDSRIARNSDQRSADDHLTLSAIKPFSKEDALHSVASEKKLPYKPLLSTSYKLNDEKETALILIWGQATWLVNGNVVLKCLLKSL